MNDLTPQSYNYEPSRLLHTVQTVLHAWVFTHDKKYQAESITGSLDSIIRRMADETEDTQIDTMRGEDFLLARVISAWAAWEEIEVVGGLQEAIRALAASAYLGDSCDSCDKMPTNYPHSVVAIDSDRISSYKCCACAGTYTGRG